jgi:hypothetical protein
MSVKTDNKTTDKITKKVKTSVFTDANLSHLKPDCHSKIINNSTHIFIQL